MKFQKPSTYLEPNVISSLHYRGGGAVATLRRLKTAEWWEFESSAYQLFTSKHAEFELSRGRYNNQRASIAHARRIRYLPATSEVKANYTTLVHEGLFPLSALPDALHLAIAMAHGIDYLLTWNQTHLANAEVRRKLDRLAEKYNWRAPWIVSPDTIPWSSLGHDIRRKDD